jgi:hypothetical protein
MEKHGAKSGRVWRKLHVAVDAGSGLILAHTLTEQAVLFMIHAPTPSYSVNQVFRYSY